MVTCKVCGGNYDNGELVGGVCLDCMEEESQRQKRSDAVAQMMKSQSEQIKLEVS